MPREPVVIAVSTTKGAYLFSSDEERKSWKKSGPVLPGESVNNITSDSEGKYYASTLTEGVFSSDDLGATWKPSSRGLHVRKVWTVEPDHHEPDTIYAGTHYGHLFRSSDSGRNWEEVAGLHNAPNRNNWGIDWGFGTIGMALHTVKSDANKKGRIYVIAAGNGTYRTDDSGETWDVLKSGIVDACTIAPGEMYSQDPKATEKEKLDEHLNQVHSCSHKLAISTKKPGLVYQQNHCGVFSTDNAGAKWKDISIDTARRHGFPITLVEGKAESLFVIPAYQTGCDMKHNSCIQGKLDVMRTDNGGKSWVHSGNGLPEKTHTVVLRDGMAHDSLDQSGVYFGTTTGEVYGSTDLGESWTQIAGNLGRIQGVSSL